MGAEILLRCENDRSNRARDQVGDRLGASEDV